MTYESMWSGSILAIDLLLVIVRISGTGLKMLMRVINPIGENIDSIRFSIHRNLY